MPKIILLDLQPRTANKFLSVVTDIELSTELIKKLHSELDYIKFQKGIEKDCAEFETLHCRLAFPPFLEILLEAM